MTFVPQKAIKGQTLADFLIAHPVIEDILDEVIEAKKTSEDKVWQIFFDGASRMGLKGKIVARVGVVFVSPHNRTLSRAFLLTKPYSNNVTEYNALLIYL